MTAAHTATLTSKRLEVLRTSLVKKEALFDAKISEHMSSVKEANGQPLNDKRNGQATLNKWGRQDDALRKINDGIAKTKAAIEREESKIAYVGVTNEAIPADLLALVADGVLTQWRKHPTTFFVVGVDKARIVWLEGKKMVAHRYFRAIEDADQRKTFARIYNGLNACLNKADGGAA